MMTCEFGPFAFDLEQGTLERRGSRVRIAPKTALLLKLLVARAGERLGTDEILDALWPDDDVVQGNVAQHIALLRKALGDDKREPTYVATDHGSGYRFIASLRSPGLSRRSAGSAALLCAFYHLQRRRPQDLRLALLAFERALAADRGHVEALLGAAEAHSSLASHLFEEPRGHFEIARHYAERALALGPYEARAQAILAHVALFFEHDLDRAIERCSLAFAEDPNDLLATRVISRVSMARGEWQSARDFLDRELAARPDSLDAMTMLAVVDQYEHRPDRAVPQLEAICAADPTFLQAKQYLGTSLMQLSAHHDALDLARKLVRIDRSPSTLGVLGRALAGAGRRSAAIGVLGRLGSESREYVSPSILAGLHAALGQFGEARERMAEAKRSRDPWAVFFQVEPRFERVLV
jgi:DNA-binding winged helix-turn-helix (wHTH) protein